MPTQQELEDMILGLLPGEHTNVRFGKTSGGNSLNAISVTQDNGEPITALAIGDCPAGTVTIFQTDTGEWYAKSANSAVVKDENQITFRRARQLDPPVKKEIYHTPVLFSQKTLKTITNCM